TDPVGPRLLAAARGLGRAAGAAARGRTPDVAGLHAGTRRPGQPARAVPLQPLRRTAGRRGLPRGRERLSAYSAGYPCRRRGWTLASARVSGAVMSPYRSIHT